MHSAVVFVAEYLGLSLGGEQQATSAPRQTARCTCYCMGGYTPRPDKSECPRSACMHPFCRMAIVGGEMATAQEVSPEFARSSAGLKPTELWSDGEMEWLFFISPSRKVRPPWAVLISRRLVRGVSSGRCLVGGGVRAGWRAIRSAALLPDLFSAFRSDINSLVF